MHTPWGQSQHEETLAEGITLVSTPGHGGILLSPERLAAMPKSLREHAPFGRYSRKWFEEDCEVALVALAFPDDLPGFSPETAHAMAAEIYPDTYAAWQKEMAG